MQRKNSQFRIGGVNIIISILVFFLIFYLFSMAVKFLWQLALLLMPILLIATFIMDRNLLINYGKRIHKIYKANKTSGLIAGGLSVLGSPLVILFLFGQAMLFRKVKKATAQHEEKNSSKFGEYVDYEEIDTSFQRLINERPKQRKEPIEIKQVPKEKRSKKDDNPYDSLWE